MRARGLAIALVATLALGMAPGDVVDLDDVAADQVFKSDNIDVVGAVPDATIVTATFASDEPLMYTSTLAGFRVFDISNPELPVPVGALPNVQFSNENVKLGERSDGTKFVLAGFDLVGYNPTADTTDTRGTNQFIVVDVTDPTNPEIAAIQNTETRTHTMGCADAECTHAYTSGSGGDFEIFDLTDITDPVKVNRVSAPMHGNSSFSGGVGHDWDVDEAGIAWWVGTGGIVAFDVSDPANPEILNSSDHRSRANEWNRYISHNSQRPDASAFETRDADDVLRDESLERSADDVRPGEVLYVTEEDLSGTVTCNDRGGFQTWHVQELDAERYDSVLDPGRFRETGTISPLDLWTTEAADDPMAESPVAGFCSAHYFDTHDSGIVAQAWYQQGLRILDPRDPTNITQIGYYITGVQEIFGAVWVPAYDDDGVQTGELTDLLYTEDPSRGLEILRVDLPDEGEAGDEVTAPVLPQWFDADAPSVTAESSDFGYACRLPLGG